MNNGLFIWLNCKIISFSSQGDTERTGRVGANAFDKMIEEAAAAPR